MRDSDVRPSPLAGTWYPRQPEALRATLDRLLDRAQPEPVPGTIHGLLAPHAGYHFSGPVAAYSFKLLTGLAFDTVVVIGPMHHPLSGAVQTTDHTAYETPLGTVPVNTEALAVIDRLVPLTTKRNDPEHSVEIELPFLQHVLQPGFSLIPLMMRDQSIARARALGQAIAQTLAGQKGKVLLVASSDLSHFYRQEIAHQLDGTMLEAIRSMDAERVITCDQTGIGFACGHGAIGAVLTVACAWNADSASILHYATSGDVTGDLAEVVGYGSAAFFKSSN